MTTHFSNLRKEIELLAGTLEQKKRELERGVSCCHHDFTQAVADHQYTEGYTIPGDAPGTMGVDWRGPCYVPSSTKHQWKRTCRTCGKVEITNKTDEVVTRTPRF
jgi:hypothetical protein